MCAQSELRRRYGPHRGAPARVAQVEPGGASDVPGLLGCGGRRVRLPCVLLEGTSAALARRCLAAGCMCCTLPPPGSAASGCQPVQAQLSSLGSCLPTGVQVLIARSDRRRGHSCGVQDWVSSLQLPPVRVRLHSLKVSQCAGSSVNQAVRLRRCVQALSSWLPLRRTSSPG